MSKRQVGVRVKLMNLVIILNFIEIEFEGQICQVVALSQLIFSDIAVDSF